MGENFNERMSMKLMDDCLENVDEEYLKTMYPGMPRSGYYDTMEGLMRHSDKYFDIESEDNQLGIREEQQVTTITQQPISWYLRKNDLKDEFVEEIHESQMRMNKHLKRRTYLSERKAKRAGKQSVNEGKQQDIEYEVDDKNIVPNYWLNIDWDKAFEERCENKRNLDKPAIFVGNELITHEIDPYEDYKLLFSQKYHALLKDVPSMNKEQIMSALHDIFKDLIPSEILNKYDDVRDGTEFLDVIVEDILSEWDEDKVVKELEEKQWSLYKAFSDKMKHFRNIHWKSAKINFDSQIRQWRRDFLKWRYLIFRDNKEHIEWRQRLRNKHLSNYDIAICKKAIVRLEQLEHLILARRTGPNVLMELVNKMEPEIFKVFYIFFEELCENGEEICMGKGWSFNRYDEQQMLPHSKTKQIPIEYFRLPLSNAKSVNSDSTNLHNKSH